MEVLDRAPAVSPDGRSVVFTLSIRVQEVDGAIARDALEEHFCILLKHDIRILPLEHSRAKYQSR